MTDLNLKELDRLEREMQGKVMSTNVSKIHEQLRPLLDLVDELEKALVCSTAGPGACGNCNPCRALDDYRRAKGKK